MRQYGGRYVHENRVKSRINVSPAKLFFSFPKRKFCVKGRRFINTQNKKLGGEMEKNEKNLGAIGEYGHNHRDGADDAHGFSRNTGRC